MTSAVGPGAGLATRGPEWRWGRGWNDAELAARLARFRTIAPSVADPEGALTSADGFNHYGSEASIAREPAGDPTPGGPFERAKGLLALYAFSDPRIVVGHFDAQEPLRERTMLLELKILGLHFLCGVRVGAVRDHQRDDRHIFAFRYDTLWGHVEAGSEWFVLSKARASGDVRLAIRAAWRFGQLPAWWMRTGFRLFARHYQRGWHRLAYLRLRRLLEANDLPELPPVRRLVQYGPRSGEQAYPPPWVVVPATQDVRSVPLPLPSPHVVSVGAPPAVISQEDDVVTT